MCSKRKLNKLLPWFLNNVSFWSDGNFLLQSWPQCPQNPPEVRWFPSSSTMVEHQALSSGSCKAVQPWKVWLEYLKGKMHFLTSWLFFSRTKQFSVTKVVSVFFSFALQNFHLGKTLIWDLFYSVAHHSKALCFTVIFHLFVCTGPFLWLYGNCSISSCQLFLRKLNCYLYLYYVFPQRASDSLARNDPSSHQRSDDFCHCPPGLSTRSCSQHLHWRCNDCKLCQGTWKESDRAWHHEFSSQ